MNDLDRLARQALAAGNLASAEQIVSEALRRDPNDPEALAIKGALAKRQAAGGAPAAGGKAAAPAPPAPPQPAPRRLRPAPRRSEPRRPRPGEPPPGAMAEGFQHDRRIIAQVIQAEVQNSISQARSLMSTDPDAALQQLKLTLEKVRQTAELDPDVRSQYVDQLQTALREASRRKVEVEQARQQRMENMAAARERELTRLSSDSAARRRSSN